MNRQINRGFILGAVALLACIHASFATTDSDRTARTEATRRIASAFLQQLFAEQDSFGSYRKFATPDFKQHNPEMADGIAGREAFFKARAAHAPGPPPKMANVYNLVMVDGDLFAIHHHAFTPDGAGRVFVDLWRVDQGRIVEHWDVIQPYPVKSLNTNSMGCGSSTSYADAQQLNSTPAHTTCPAPDPKVSRAASLATFNRYVAEVGKGDVHAAIRRWFSADYRQHSPDIADGASGAIDYLDREFNTPGKARPRPIHTRILSEGDYVLVHRQVIYPGSLKPSTNVDIFRIQKGKISEHWDVKQVEPEHPANGNGMW